MLQAVVLVAGILMGTSGVVSVLIGVAVIVFAHSPEAAGEWISNGHALLVGLMPVALWLALQLSYDDNYAAYATRLRALLTTLQGALIGSTLGAGPIFLVVVIYLPVLVAGFDLDSFGLAVYNAIVWSRLGLAIAAAMISALPLGLWAHYASSARARD